MAQQGSTESRWQSELLTTKLDIPLPKPRIVRRNRLIRRLQAGMDRQITLIVAPTGYGKTTLLGELTSIISGTSWRIAWVSLDPYDNLPIRFWSYVSAALKKADPQFIFNPEVLIQSSFDLRDLTQINPLINAIALVPHSIYLILDDYQWINDERVHLGLSYLLEHLPKNLHLVIASRSMPRIPLSRLRVLNQVVDINTADLSFDLDETRLFLSGVMGIEVEPDQIARLVKATEGWVAGLQLAALSLQSQPDSPLLQQADQLVEQHQITAYLTEEVLNHLEADTRDFLLKTSILSELSAPLCNAMLERTDSQEILNRIERANLFLVALDNEQRWFRYHTLFAETLRAELDLDQPGVAAGLHNRACDWLVGNGYTDRAVEHALAAGDLDKAAEIVDNCVMQVITRLDLSSLVHWISCFSEDLIHKHPRLGIYYALSAQELGLIDLAQEKLEVVEQALTDHGESSIPQPERDILSWKVAAIRAMKTCAIGDPYQGLEEIWDLIHNAPEGDDFIYGSLNHCLGMTYDMVGDFSAAIEGFDNASKFARAHHLDAGYVHSRCELARLMKIQGRLIEAEEEYRLALEYGLRCGLETNINALAETGLIEIAAERNMAASTREWVEDVRAYLDTLENNAFIFHYPVILYARLSMYFLAVHDVGNARLFQQKALQAFNEDRKPYFMLTAELIDNQVLLPLAEGDVDTAEAWLDDEREYISPIGEASLAAKLGRAKICLARNMPGDALQILAPVEQQTRSAGIGERLLETLILQSLAHYQARQLEPAFRTLGEALELGRTNGYFRTFVTSGRLMKPLLSDYRSSIGRTTPVSPAAGEYLDRLIGAFDFGSRSNLAQPAEANHPTLSFLPDSLTEREVEVLEMLVVGKSTKEVAATLMISFNTAKAHVKSIYRKLGVHTRKAFLQRTTEWSS